jgi:hypothetical protein
MKEIEAEFEPPDGIAKGGSVIVLYPRCRIANVAKYGLAGTCNERLSQNTPCLTSTENRKVCLRRDNGSVRAASSLLSSLTLQLEGSLRSEPIYKDSTSCRLGRD